MRADSRSEFLHTAIEQRSSDVLFAPVSNKSLDRLKVLFVTSARMEGPANQNHFQRIMVLSELADLTILAPKGAEFSLAKRKGARVISPLFPGRPGVIAEVARFAMRPRTQAHFDVVLTDPSILGLCGLVAKLVVPSAKWVVDIWDIPIRCQSKRWWLKRKAALVRILMRSAYRSSDLFLVSILPSLELKWFALPEAKIRHFGNAIWRGDFKALREDQRGPDRQRNILCMRSKYDSDMGLDTLAQAFNSLIHECPDLTLTIIGVMPPEVKKQIEPLLTIPGVKVLGFIPHPEVLERINQATVCVVPFKDVPDLAQTCPIKVLEYLSMGKPVVASNIPGIASMIQDGQNGMLFRPGDPQDLADKLSAVIRDAKLRERLSRSAEQLDRKYDAQVKGEQILTVLRGIAANQGVR